MSPHCTSKEVFYFVFNLILKGSFCYHYSYAKNEGVYGAFRDALEVKLCKQKPKLVHYINY